MSGPCRMPRAGRRAARIEFQFKADAGGQTVEVKYTGTIVSPASMKGTAAFGDLGSGAWKAEKQ